MLISKKGIPFLFTVIFFCITCINKQPAHNSAATSNNLLLQQFKRYDSFNNIYNSSLNIDILKQSGKTADSILLIPLSEIDTPLYKKYLAVLFNRAADLHDLGNFIKSRDLSEKYIFLRKEQQTGSNVYLAFTKKNLANIYSRYGDYKKAALLLNECLKYYTSAKDTVEMSSCIINLSIPLKELQNYIEAAQILQELFTLPSAPTRKKAVACVELADIFTRQRKLQKASLQIQQAKQLLAILPNDLPITETYGALLSVEGNFYIENNQPQKALAAYRQSLDSAKKSSAQNLRNREIGKTYIAMGKALEQLQYTDSALIFYTKALYTVINVDTLNKFSLPRPNDIYAENTIAEALYARADCIVNRDIQNIAELENAVSCYKLAFATESKLLNGFSYDESRLYMVNETRKQTEKAIAVCYQLYKKTNNNHWANEAFLFTEHNKAFVLQESVRRNTAALLFLQNDTLYAKIQQLQSSLALTEIELGRQHFATTPDTALLQSLNTAKQKTEEELLAAENNIRIKNPQYNNWLNEESTFSAEDIINKIIPGNTALAEYFTGDSSLYIFTAAKKKPLNFYKLNDTVKTVVVDFLHFFSTQNVILNNPVQYASVAHQLYQSLLGPYLPQGNAALLIIPDGFISYIPFDALLTSGTTSTNIVAFPFLIKQQQTYYAFSCKILLAQAQINNSAADNSLAAFAPIFANKERGVSPLVHSNEELDAIKQLYPNGKFFTGANATLKQFDNNCNNTSIIHLATHASPGNDTLPARIELYDSSVYINLVYAKKINAKLVVLSGCETGTGTLNKSEGLMSLARGFSYAGTKNVIASLWQTEDNSSATIFKNFYSNLPNTNISAALHKAKLDFLNNSSVAEASPYYWSGYIYIGTPGESLTAPSPSEKIKWVTVLTSLFLITAYFIWSRRGRQKSIG